MFIWWVWVFILNALQTKKNEKLSWSDRFVVTRLPTMYNSVRITGQKRLLYSLDKFGFLIFLVKQYLFQLKCWSTVFFGLFYTWLCCGWNKSERVGLTKFIICFNVWVYVYLSRRKARLSTTGRFKIVSCHIVLLNCCKFLVVCVFIAVHNCIFEWSDRYLVAIENIHSFFNEDLHLIEFLTTFLSIDRKNITSKKIMGCLS